MELAAALRRHGAPLAEDGARDLRPLQRAAPGAGLHDAGPAAAVPGRGRVHDRRPRGPLDHHQALALRHDPPTCVYPTWRPDRALGVDDPPAFNEWLNRLEAAAGASIAGFQQFMDALGPAPRRLPRSGLPRVRPRAGGAVRRAVDGRRGRGDVRQGASGPHSRPRRGPTVPLGPPPPLRDHGPRAGLGAAVPPGRAPQQQHAAPPKARTGHGLRLHRRLRDGAAPRPLPRPPRRDATSSPRPSSTT